MEISSAGSSIQRIIEGGAAQRLQMLRHIIDGLVQGFQGSPGDWNEIDWWRLC
jgi:hypothetical protein